MQMHRAIDPPMAGMVETGWALAPAFHGRGLAREGLAAVFDFAGRHLPAQPLWCMIAPLNLRSVRLALSLGFTPQGQSVYREQPVLVLTRHAMQKY